jgi:hypothetical protein
MMTWIPNYAVGTFTMDGTFATITSSSGCLQYEVVPEHPEPPVPVKRLKGRALAMNVEKV